MKIVAYVLMVAGLITLAPWLMMAPMSVMAFDAGASVMAYVVVGLAFAYPVWLLYWLHAALQNVRAGNDGKAAGLALLGAGPALLILAAVFGSSFVSK